MDHYYGEHDASPEQLGEQDTREIQGLRNIVEGSEGMIHHIHAPGEDGPDDPGASPFWQATENHTWWDRAAHKLRHYTVSHRFGRFSK